MREHVDLALELGERLLAPLQCERVVELDWMRDADAAGQTLIEVARVDQTVLVVVATEHEGAQHGAQDRVVRESLQHKLDPGPLPREWEIDPAAERIGA